MTTLQLGAVPVMPILALGTIAALLETAVTFEQATAVSSEIVKAIADEAVSSLVD